MAAKGKTQKKPRTKTRAEGAISPDWPVWYDPASPLGSAVRYVAALSPRFRWVGVSRKAAKGTQLVAGPSIGARAAKSSPVIAIPVRGRDGKLLGQIDIDSREAGGLAPGEVKAVTRVATELGELWPA